MKRYIVRFEAKLIGSLGVSAILYDTVSHDPRTDIDRVREELNERYWHIHHIQFIEEINDAEESN